MVEGIYEHFKGGRYKVTGTRLLVGKINEIEIEEPVVEYQNHAGEKFARLMSDFTEKVHRDGKVIPRFRYLPLARGL